MTQSSPRSVALSRVSAEHYVATNSEGASLEFGHGDGLFTPVELLLAAIGGCSSIDVDAVTSRHAEPTEFTVHVKGEYTVDDQGAHKMENIGLDFHVEFPADGDGQRAAGLVERLVKLSHEKDCTVSRTVQLPTSIISSVDDRTVTEPEDH